MNWYYIEQGKQAGPVADEQLDQMIQTGAIQPATLVWREGMADWMPYSSARGGAPAGATGTEAAEEAVCSECGKVLPAEETIRYGNARVCAACKPVFLQKLREGAALNTGELNYASFGARFGGYIIDGVILFAVNLLFSALRFLVSRTAAGAPEEVMAIQFIFMGINLAVAISYETIMVAKYGATLGKMAVGTRVVTADGGRVSYARAFGRYWAKVLSFCTCLIGFIMAAFDKPQRRALHDYICNTRVIYK